MAKGAVRSVNIYVNTKEANIAFDELKKRIDRETAAWKKMAKGTQEYYAKAAEISRMNDALEKEERLIKSSTEKNKERLNQISMIGSVLSGIVQTVQFLGRGLQKVRDLASDMAGLDDAMGRVRKTTMLSRQEVAELNKEFAKIDTRTSREELNELAYAAGKLGVNGKEDVLEFVKAADVINVALGDVLGGTDAIIEVTKLAQVFKDTTKEIRNAGLEETLIRTGSVINELGKTSTANEGQIAKFLGRIASYASIAGMSLDQMAGLGSVLSQNSKAPEMSATAVTKIMQQMIKKTGSFADMIGMGEKELSDLMAKDFNQAFLAVLQKLHDIGDVQAIVPIFKDLGADATRASQVILALSTNIDKVRVAQETASKAIKEGTSMNKEYSVMNETLQAQMEKAKKTVFDARVELGEKLYPYIVKYMMFGGKVIKWLSRVTEHAENAWMAIAAAGAVAIAKVRKNLEGLRERFSELGPVQEFRQVREAQKELSESKDRQKALQKQYNLTHKVSEERSKRILATENEIFKKTQQRVAVMKDLNYTEAGALSRLNGIHAAEVELQAAERERLAVMKRMDTNSEEQATLNTKLQSQEAELAKLARDRELTEKRLAGLYTGPTSSRTAIAKEENRLKTQQAQIEARINTLESERNTPATALAAKQKEGLVLEQQRSAAANRLLLAEKRKSEVLQEHKAILQQIVEKGGAQGALAQKLLANEEQLTALENERLALMKEQEGTLSRERAIERGITAEEHKQNALRKSTTALSVLKNHWMLILTVVIEVGLMIAKIVKEQNKFRKELNKTYEETVKNTQAERMEAEWLFDALNRANTAEDERLRIMKQLNEKYGDYLRNLTDEEGRIMNIEAAHRAVIDAIIAENNAKGFAKAKEQLGEKYGGEMQTSLSAMYNLLKNSTVNGQKITDGILSYIWKNVNDMIGKNYREDQIKAYLNRSGVNFGTEWAGGQSGVVLDNEDRFFSIYASYANTRKKYDKDLTEQQRLYNMELESSEEKLQRLTNMYTQLKQQYESAPNDKEKADRKKEMDAYLNDIAAAFEDKMLQGHDIYKMKWIDLAQLEEYIKKQMKAIEGTTAWTKKLEGAQRALKRVQEQMKKSNNGGSNPTTEFPDEEDDYDPSSPVTSGKESGKTPEERWADLMKKSAKLNEKAAVESLGISAAKEAVVKTYNAIIAEVESFNETYKGFEERAAAENARLEQEKWDEIARIEDEERAKRLKKIDDNLASVTEKLNKFRLKQQRKYQTQLETDMEEMENDFGKLRQKAEEERNMLYERKDASLTIGNMFDWLSDKDVVEQAFEDNAELFGKIGLTREKWEEVMKQKPRNAQDLLALLGLKFDDEDQRKLDKVTDAIKELDTAKLAEMQALITERAREIVTATSDSVTRQYREAMKTIEEQILTLEAAQRYLQEHNDGGENDERIEEIEKTLSFLRGRKSDIQTKYDTAFGKDTWATLFGITEEDWAAWDKNWEDNLSKMTDRLRTFADNAFELWSAIDSVMQNQADAELQRYEEMYDSKSAVLQRQLDSGLISQKRYDAQMERMQKEKEKKEKKLKHDAFERERTANLIQGAVNLALTISSVFANEPGGLIIKSAASAIAAAIQATQLAVIASQPNPYYKGGYIRGRQYAVMGEQGDEWVASNRLLRDRETADIIAALDEYQRGDRKALAGISIPPPNLKSVSQAISENGRTFAPSNQVTNNYYPSDNGELLKEIRQMNDYLRDPNNRRAIISRKIQLEFDEQEREIRELARL